MADRRQQRRAQKVDHGGDFVQLPRVIMRSPAFLRLSQRARSCLLVMLERFNGFNNGRIGLSIDNLGAALGNQNHRANSRALIELMDRGFLECMAGANHVKSKAREYRLTFIESTGGKATNEWKLWQPPEKNGPEATATREWKPVEATATRRKPSVEATATRATETCGVGGRFRVEATAAHIISQYQPSAPAVSDLGNSFKSSSELRTALNRLIETGETTARAIALAINMPAGTMSKFRNGKGLPQAYVGPLHMELGKRDAFSLPSASSSPVMIVGDMICWRVGKRLHVLPGILTALTDVRAQQSRMAA